MTEIENNFSSLEWLETNGLGGFASGNLDGSHSRRYHGLLFTEVDAERVLLLSKFNEVVSIKGKRFDLTNQKYLGGNISSDFQTKFAEEINPHFTYKIDDVTITKSIVMPKYRNITLIKYQTDSLEDVELELTPLVAFRNYHSLNQAYDINSEHIFQDGVFSMRPNDKLPGVFIRIPGSEFESDPKWHKDFYYTEEQSRGYDFSEDLFSPGRIKVRFGGIKREILVCVSMRLTNNPEQLYKSELNRRKKIFDLHKNPFLKTLSHASDKLLINKGNAYSIIAGYPWFSVWSRDSLISALGISLALKDFNILKEVLISTSKNIKNGLVPNYVPDVTQELEYNSIDAPLLFINACYQYYQHTSDINLVIKLLPSMMDIIENYKKGTEYNIKMQEDGLISTTEGALTWMDAKINDYCVTSRHGKAVEINALWYNAIKIAEYFSWRTLKIFSAFKLRGLANHIKSNFNQEFWHNSLYLYDCINYDTKDASIRPNQIFAASLPFNVVDKVGAQKIISTVENYLLNSHGLKTLNSENTDYRGMISGDTLSRDSAYHQGTIWVFLLGSYVDAVVKFGTKDQLTGLRRIISGFEHKLTEYGVNGLPEIYDADAPHKPRGCILQAWSVAEIFRSAITLR